MPEEPRLRGNSTRVAFHSSLPQRRDETGYRASSPSVLPFRFALPFNDGRGSNNSPVLQRRGLVSTGVTEVTGVMANQKGSRAGSERSSVWSHGGLEAGSDRRDGEPLSRRVSLRGSRDVKSPLTGSLTSRLPAQPLGAF
ncbi:hypothetical protein SKAU_G00064960 [Synaphobranchus kaupii]|uniref:Uncharacterized protein n=1 Tax=Synaphobranchus kaupii TaxID=118154 RepID=A0A9Q1J9Z3_SYNKA|nr:hypothetical protein SKAU_G00064960 [Synaphobranchus kaupii]